MKARLNWGKMDSPRLAGTAQGWATAVTTAFAMLRGIVADDGTGLIATECMEVEEEWQGQ